MLRMIAVFALGFSASAIAQTPSPGSGCAIDGYVVNSITGEPVPRAFVTVAGPGGQAAISADNSGRWKFANIGCGSVQVMASRPGFLPTGPAALRGGGGHPIMLSAGSPVKDEKIQMVPQAVVIGKVIDEEGDPVQGAQVVALTARVVEGRRALQPVGSMQTNDLGEYRISNLQSGKYIVCSSLNRNFPGIDSAGDAMVYADVCYPGPAESGAATAMEVPPGRETRVDFNLRKVAGVHVRGMVSGLPKNAGVGAQLVKRGLNIGFGNRPANVAQDGRFDIRGVTPGAWMLMSDYWDGGKRLSGRAPVDVGGADVDGVVLHLESGFTLNGTVRFESKNGTPPADYQFHPNLRPVDGSGGAGQVKWSADRKTFTIEDLVPGAYRLDFFYSYAAFFVKSAMLGGRDISREAAQLGPGAGTLEVVLSDDGGSVEGQTADANGQPVVSWVMLLQDGRMPANVRSGPDGHFKLQNVAPGDYRIFAFDEMKDVEYADADWMRQHAEGAAVTVQAGQTAQVSLVQKAVSAE